MNVALGHDFQHGSLTIQHPWARATPPVAENGAAYFVVLNQGETEDRLLGADAAVAERVELHTHTTDNGVMRMRQIPYLELPAGVEVGLEPGGMHVMLIGLEGPLVDGESFPMTLTFQNAGAVTVEVKISREAP